VYEKVPECDDTVCMSNLSGDSRITLPDPVYRLADNLEISLNGLTDQSIGLVSVRRKRTGFLQDERSGVTNVAKLLQRFRLHK